MCESKAVEIIGNEEKQLLDDVALLEFQDDKLILYNIKGEKLELPTNEYTIVKIDFLKHKIFFKKK